MSLTLLKRLRRLGKVAEFTRRYDQGVPLRVVVRAVSEWYVHVAVLGVGETITQQSVLRREDVRIIRWGQELGMGLSKSEILEKVSYIHLDTLTTIFNSLDSKRILATVQCEAMNPVFAITGRRFLLKEGLLMGEEISDMGRPCGFFGLNMMDITRVDFAGASERRLEKMLAETT